MVQLSPLATVLLVLLVLIVVSLGRSLWCLLRSPQAELLQKTQKSLSWRLLFSLLLFILAVVACSFGLFSVKIY
jgi:hypothetical protein